MEGWAPCVKIACSQLLLDNSHGGTQTHNLRVTSPIAYHCVNEIEPLCMWMPTTFVWMTTPLTRRISHTASQLPIIKAAYRHIHTTSCSYNHKTLLLPHKQSTICCLVILFYYESHWIYISLLISMLNYVWRLEVWTICSKSNVEL